MDNLALLAVEVELVAVELLEVELAVRSWDRSRHWYTVADIRFRKSVWLVAELVLTEQYSWVPGLRLYSNKVELRRTGIAE